MGDCCLFCTEGDLEVLAQEGLQFFLDLLRQGLGPTDTNDPIVSIPQIFEADEVGVIDLHGGDTSDLSYQFAEFFCTRCSFLHEAPFSFGELLRSEERRVGKGCRSRWWR